MGIREGLARLSPAALSPAAWPDCARDPWWQSRRGGGRLRSINSHSLRRPPPHRLCCACAVDFAGCENSTRSELRRHLAHGRTTNPAGCGVANGGNGCLLTAVGHATAGQRAPRLEPTVRNGQGNKRPAMRRYQLQARTDRSDLREPRQVKRRSATLHASGESRCRHAAAAAEGAGVKTPRTLRQKDWQAPRRRGVPHWREAGLQASPPKGQALARASQRQSLR